MYNDYSHMSPKSDFMAFLKFVGVYTMMFPLFMALMYNGNIHQSFIYTILFYFIPIIFLSMIGFNYLQYGRLTIWLRMKHRYTYYCKYEKYHDYNNEIYNEIFKKYEVGNYLIF